MEVLKGCPICNHKENKPFLNCKDYTVSSEIFSIVACENCGFKFTNPRPSEEEIGPYYKSEEYISHSNTSKGLVNSIYQIVRKYTLGKKFKMIASLTAGNSILDYGVGAGVFLNYCKEQGWKAAGVEADKETREAAIKNFDLSIISSNQLHTFQKESFDIITLWHVLEHVHQLQETIEGLLKLLKPKGKIIIAVPNCDSYDAQLYKEHWAAYDLPRHIYHFTPKDIKNLFKTHNYNIIKTLPMVFDSFYVSMLSEKYKTGANNLPGAFLSGLKSNLLSSGKEKYSSQIYILEKG